MMQDLRTPDPQLSRRLRLNTLIRLRWLAILSGRLKASLVATGGIHTALDAVNNQAHRAGAGIEEEAMPLIDFSREGFAAGDRAPADAGLRTERTARRPPGRFSTTSTPRASPSPTRSSAPARTSPEPDPKELYTDVYAEA